jgi:outer membrane protein TolC
VAQSTLNLTQQQLEQSRDRFSAGVTNNLEVVQAQESVATAQENLISSMLTFNLAKISLARALGDAEHNYRAFLLGGTQ